MLLLNDLVNMQCKCKSVMTFAGMIQT